MSDTIVSFTGLTGGTKEYKAIGDSADEQYSIFFPKVLAELKVYVDDVLVEDAFSSVPFTWTSPALPLYYTVPVNKILKLVATGPCNVHLHHSGTLQLQ